MSAPAFDYGAFLARYPEFSSTTNATQAAAFYLEACDLAPYVISSATDPAALARLLNMLTAHLAQLNVGSSKQPFAPVIGRVGQATEGSVSVQMAYSDAKTGSEAWYQQTQYGVQYWQMTAPYRSALYVPGSPRNMDPYRPW